jgi:hypothetical protein
MLDEDTREKLRFIFPKVGVPSDATDWLDTVEESASVFVGEAPPTEQESLNARAIMLRAGIPAVYFAAALGGVSADGFELDPPPDTTWYVGALAVG